MNKSLFNTDFTSSSAAAWKQKIQYELEGADYASSVIYKNPEGIDIKPFYCVEDSENGISSEQSRSKRSSTIGVYDVETARKQAAAAINSGTDLLIFKCYNPQIDFKSLIEDLAITVHIRLLQLNEELIAQLQSIDTTISFSIDPISKLTSTGNWYLNKTTDFKLLLDFLKLNNNQRKCFLEINGQSYSESGANCSYQAGLIAAHFAEYLHFLEATNELTVLEDILIFTNIGNQSFFELAKINAIRSITAALLKAFNSKAKIKLYTQTSTRYYTLYQAELNQNRNAISMLISAMAGVDFIEGIAYDSLHKHVNSKSTNETSDQTSEILQSLQASEHTTNLTGSYTFEKISTQLADQALTIFKQIEQKGGLISGLFSGSIQSKIKEQHLKEADFYKSNKETLFSLNAYKNKKETIKKQLERNPFLKKKNKKTLVEPILSRRIAAAFEFKRYTNE